MYKKCFSIIIIILLLLLAGCLNSSDNSNVDSNNPLVYGTAIKYYHNDHEGTQINLKGTSDNGYSVERKTETQKNGEWSFDNIPAGTYEITFYNYIHGSLTYHDVVKQIVVNEEPTQLSVKIPFHFSAQIINAVGRDGIVFSSPIKWSYTTNKDEADLYLESGNLITPNRDAIQVINISSYTILPNDYSLSSIEEVPTEGYQNSVSFDGTKFIAFKTKNGNYGKGYIDSGHLQWVISPNNIFDW